MSSLLNKARDKVEAIVDRNSNQRNEIRSDNHGAHSNNAMHQADPTVRSDLDHRTNPQGRAGDFGGPLGSHQLNTGHTTGTVTSSDTYGSNTNPSSYDNPSSTNAGPHSSNITNQLNPRMDSDRDHRNDPTSRVGGFGTTQHHHENYDSSGRAGELGETNTGYGNTPTAYNQTSTTTGPHRSNLANKLDPRYDGDVENRHNLGSTTSSHGHGHGHNSHTGTGVHDLTTVDHGNTFGSTHSTNTGPHNSGLLNKLDPRHEHGRDQRHDPSNRVAGHGSTQTGGYDNIRNDEYNRPADVSHSHPHLASGTTTGYGGQSGDQVAGYGDSHVTAGSGTAKKTAGPHNSNLLNQLDPRVDSDMDGSKTYGGNKTQY